LGARRKEAPRTAWMVPSAHVKLDMEVADGEDVGHAFYSPALGSHRDAERGRSSAAVAGVDRKNAGAPPARAVALGQCR